MQRLCWSSLSLALVNGNLFYLSGSLPVSPISLLFCFCKVFIVPFQRFSSLRQRQVCEYLRFKKSTNTPLPEQNSMIRQLRGIPGNSQREPLKASLVGNVSDNTLRWVSLYFVSYCTYNSKQMVLWTNFKFKKIIVYTICTSVFVNFLAHDNQLLERRDSIHLIVLRVPTTVNWPSYFGPLTACHGKNRYLSFFSCCCDEMLERKQGQEVMAYFSSQFKVTIHHCEKSHSSGSWREVLTLYPQ